MDARIERTRAAVIDAATELLLDGGPSAVTVDAIVAASGVAKSTFYRHWATRDDLVIELFQLLQPDVAPLDLSLGFVECLRAALHAVVDVMNGNDWGRLLPAMLMVRQRMPAIAGLEQQMRHEQREQFAALLRLGVEEGLIRDGQDPDRVIELLVGPIVHASMVGDGAERTLADEVLQRFLASEQALSSGEVTPSGRGG